MRKTVKITTALYIAAIAGTLLFANACNKNMHDCKHHPDQQTMTQPPATDHRPEISTVTIANIHATKDGTSMRIMFNEKEQIFTAQNNVILNTLQDAFKNGAAVTITTDPWSGLVTDATATTTLQRQRSGAALLRSAHAPTLADMATASADEINSLSGKDIEGLGIAPTDTTHLTNMIPDIATARLMFTYIAQQCCALPGPYAIDYCIPFQYAIDGCYARAHKMCWILNTKYHYGTQKIFSFANLGADELCVKGDKWGGCCVNWWYHVAPLVTVKTPTGPKAYVFDPAMFDQPVLLSVWLGAQQNGTCVPGGDVPHVSMYTVQPTSAYWPADGTGMDFDTDPTFSSTDYYLHDYANLHTCP